MAESLRSVGSRPTGAISAAWTTQRFESTSPSRLQEVSMKFPSAARLRPARDQHSDHDIRVATLVQGRIATCRRSSTGSSPSSDEQWHSSSSQAAPGLVSGRSRASPRSSFDERPGTFLPTELKTAVRVQTSSASRTAMRAEASIAPAVAIHLAQCQCGLEPDHRVGVVGQSARPRRAVPVHRAILRSASRTACSRTRGSGSCRPK